MEKASAILFNPMCYEPHHGKRKKKKLAACLVTLIFTLIFPSILWWCTKIAMSSLLLCSLIGFVFWLLRMKVATPS